MSQTNASIRRNATDNKENVFAKWLIDNGSLIIHQNYEYGCSPLHRAVMEENIQIVKYLVEKGANVNTKVRGGEFPIHFPLFDPLLFPLQFAAALGNLEIVKFLVNNGADIDARNKFNRTSANIANLFGYHEIEEYLTEKEIEKETANVLEEIVSNKALCVVCLAPRNGFYILSPCHHSSLCKLCCVKLKGKNCPTCRKIIQNYNKIYFQ